MDSRMRARLDAMVARRAQLEAELARPEVARDPVAARRLGRELARMEAVLDRYGRYREAERETADLKQLLREESDPELRELAEGELEARREEMERLEAALAEDLLPRDPNDDKNVLLEIRAGTGGEEAALFAGDLLRMYMRFAERHGWRTEILSSNPTDIGGYKEVILLVEGEGAYSRLKYESGVHRVQRVPETEASGRIHTSAATVAVLPEAEEVEVEINPEDLKIETMRAGGAGGQHVNKTESAVRITHLPTGISVHSQDERSQHKNRERAMRILRARLKQLAEEAAASEVAEARRAQVGTGDRSERIRTYNFPQSRVTDHRVNLTLYRLAEVLDGDLDEIIDALASQAHAEQLAGRVP
ncbi:MAG: peptide chain release factor 1 [Actinomycetia bacterium]|jgi:peptide chain release factor 1|nr:peptide chain release factor 1 [Actinomycetes bacterium]